MEEESEGRDLSNMEINHKANVIGNCSISDVVKEMTISDQVKKDFVQNFESFATIPSSISMKRLRCLKLKLPTWRQKKELTVPDCFGKISNSTKVKC